MATRTAFPIVKFQYPDSTPVANGYATIRLNQDGIANSVEQVGTNFVTVRFDSSGVPIGSPTFWSNGVIQPPNTNYILLVYSALGQLVAGPLIVNI